MTTPTTPANPDWMQELEQLDRQVSGADNDASTPAVTTASTTTTDGTDGTAVADDFLAALSRFEARREQRQQQLQCLVPGYLRKRTLLLATGGVVETTWELQGKYPNRTVRRELLWLFQAPCCLDVEVFTTPQALGEKPIRFCACQKKQNQLIADGFGL